MVVSSVVSTAPSGDGSPTERSSKSIDAGVAADGDASVTIAKSYSKLESFQRGCVAAAPLWGSASAPLAVSFAARLCLPICATYRRSFATQCAAVRPLVGATSTPPQVWKPAALCRETIQG